MLEKSIQLIKEYIAELEGSAKENKQILETRIPQFEETKKKRQKLIDASTTLPVERLRALIMNVIESGDIMQLHRLQVSLIRSMLFANEVRIFQEEVSYELNVLNAKVLLQKPEAGEPEKYAKIEKDLDDVKHTMEEESKPLMDMLRDAIKKRDDFLEKNR